MATEDDPRPLSYASPPPSKGDDRTWPVAARVGLLLAIGAALAAALVLLFTGRSFTP